ncbi:putative mitochondrial hypothetical protein [Leptomonas pyrrhocoris]|uniref:RNase III domain-containing protein n=1 Tax=Leptomonas pyrrhocoris TaxID=157538 RepID=A0A0N0DT40_LEPPY|nr:putative mitochondrial hypothetical protein [Leptomonas pyrrhocoris]KPA76872.1 putative mitochondrial hypothetical protein [Leptomonas pyrrhocoris]|eukprot:XP_015655311.1 putative mitochondrial hypothetical protein [Leptomonas pyrrhocoris]
MRHCLRLCSKGVDMTAYRCLLQALRQCGVAYQRVLPDTTPAALSSGAASSFLPLFTTKFHFHQHQLTTLGDALVDRYISATLLQYCIRRGSVLTTNAAAEINAVLHNHFTLRLFAKELQFEAMAMSPEQSLHSLDDLSDNTLGFLEAERASVRRQDVAGTSHQVALLACGQSSLGWKFSQFVGAVHQTFGSEAATRVLEHVYALQDEPNVPRRASQLLLRVLEHFPATGVAEAVLAAQGLAVHYTAKSRLLPDVTEEVKAGTTSSTQSASHDVEGKGEMDRQQQPSSSDASWKGGRPVDELSIVTGFDVAGAEQSGVTLDGLGDDALRSGNLAKGPGLIDSADMWRRRTAELVTRRLEPSHEAGALLTSSTNSTDGWLSAQERATYERGPAFAGWVDFAAFSTYADVYGPTQPENGRIVRRVKFKKHVRDPRFYDTMSDARNGVPFDTNGETLSDYLNAFTRPHRRLFEVTMLAGRGGEVKLVGRAISPRYTTARESAARAFLGGALRDVLALEGSVGESGREAPSS